MPVFRFFRSRDPRCWRCCLFAAPCVNDETRFNGSIYESATYAPRAEEILVKAEISFNRDASAADRVREVFGQFIPNEARRGNRYSSLGTIIRYLRGPRSFRAPARHLQKSRRWLKPRRLEALCAGLAYR